MSRLLLLLAALAVAVLCSWQGPDPGAEALARWGDRNWTEAR